MAAKVALPRCRAAEQRRYHIAEQDVASISLGAGQVNGKQQMIREHFETVLTPKAGIADRLVTVDPAWGIQQRQARQRITGSSSLSNNRRPRSA